jgi:hypothetical protein
MEDIAQEETSAFRRAWGTDLGPFVPGGSAFPLFFGGSSSIRCYCPVFLIY